ncbi:MAG: YdiU family protein [Gammaproteobacteria bacterium]|jgi:uncharacterized protein YdiU (UPF0061 family)|nr:YdiU family protein [Gammaproteobacteria bacterium]MBT3858498.1 YdiU family protein [Gammaproteobacteria bacterium]MBT3986764.1 YdiU family protein [Gammaproteobacteria bacterium]MBT4257074.1 YdiU family protein [Gammaproteobacteria bacterium]MBT4582860.1 YdiU family protein [Gammaproteobacteria bacterium]
MISSNSYIGLGERFYEEEQPIPVSEPELFLWNDGLAEQLQICEILGLDSCSNPGSNSKDFSEKDSKILAEYFSGNQIVPDSSPIALAYAGHQFGQFNPQLGDGRAHLLGEVLDRDGKYWDLQLKGSGPTSFSRGGDGRCGIGPAIREFLMSEAMHALGVPSTRCLSVVTTGEAVYRDRVLPGAVVSRIASSHLRVGSFQFYAARGDVEALQLLRDFAIEKHCPEFGPSFGSEVRDDKERTLLLLDWAIEKQIHLVVEWMRVGFIHGVLNTDNTALSGETIDFGPCAMMGVYDPATVYSSIDHMGRYAFGKQPNIIHWNLARFAECLLPLIKEDDKQSADKIESMIAEVPDRISEKYSSMMASKFGIAAQVSSDSDLLNSLLEHFAVNKLDYTNTFNLLTESLSSGSAREQSEGLLKQFFPIWWSRIVDQEISMEQVQALMRKNNPVVIPRNHHVEAAVKSAEEALDPALANRMLEVMRNPYRSTTNTALYQDLPVDGDKQYQTFCGT